MIYEKITSRQNSAVKYIRALSRDRELRRERRQFVCDGEKLLREALAEKADIALVLAEESFAEKLPDIEGARICTCPRDILESTTNLKSAQEVVFVCGMKEPKPCGTHRALLLDRLQDTGNIGTIIRTADAFGIDAIFEDGCADIYNPKTVRSAMGSIFRVPVITADFTVLIPELRAEGKKVYASELYGTVMKLSECDLKNAAVVIGNEGNGVRREVSELCTASVIIPMRGGAESLNAAVAASVFMYKMSEDGCK